MTKDDEGLLSEALTLWLKLFNISHDAMEDMEGRFYNVFHWFHLNVLSCFLFVFTPLRVGWPPTPRLFCVSFKGLRGAPRLVDIGSFFC